MKSKMQVKLLSPAREHYQGEVELAVLPAADGYVGILRNHAQLVSTLGVGVMELSIQKSHQKKSVFVSGGIFRIRDNLLEVLADVLETKEEIDLPRAFASKKRAEQRLRDAYKQEMNVSRAIASLQRALSRIGYAS